MRGLASGVTSARPRLERTGLPSLISVTPNPPVGQKIEIYYELSEKRCVILSRLLKETQPLVNRAVVLSECLRSDSYDKLTIATAPYRAQTKNCLALHQRGTVSFSFIGEGDSTFLSL
jgi:hypothetical protein